MNESFLHYAWKMRLFEASNLKTTAGEELNILKPGDHNTDAGPDFHNAKIKIGDTTWAGNVEIHINSSDWNLHKHSSDKAYDNVILHVVYNHDDINSTLPTLKLQGRIDEALVNKYTFLMQTAQWIPCAKNIVGVPDIIVRSQINRMLAERMQEKALTIEQRLLMNKNNWEETAYQLLARNFGTNVNADPFERLARNLPFNILRRHFNNSMQIEALLFGQAGFLQANFKELYPHQLQSEFVFLKEKYKLEPLRPLEWKFLRLRPSNFPTLRLSQFADFISRHDRIFKPLIEAEDRNSLVKLFESEAAPYWKEHYSFKKASKIKSARLGDDTIDLLLINTVIPLMYLYGQKTGDEVYTEKALQILSQIPAENNTIMRGWETLGIKMKSAADSQAFLYLRKEYCTQRRCLHCAIGHAILQQKNA